jgi:hypothetical protein
MLKTETAVQRFPSLRAVALFVEVAGDAGEGKVLHQQLHHLHEDVVFFGVDLEALAVFGDAEAVGDFFDAAFDRGVAGEFATPLDRGDLPSGVGALAKQVVGERSVEDVAGSFEVGHGFGLPPAFALFGFAKALFDFERSSDSKFFSLIHV